ncbi:18.1 kDa class I heat shock protein-like [Trifolium pratense]|uniref:18.1 kDa class I heat shock protein-like n=1 Tax=Trifolium pratense TaxID=57577 RepID=UPI001E6922E7|nr:18.1 kDa class I heat shock protein-like [Trifolium pratense]
MSLFPTSNFGRRRSEPQQNHHNQTWHNPSYQQKHGYETHLTTTAFYNVPSPILNTHIEWKETHEAYKAHLPGLKRNDVRVEVDDDRVLCIICEKSASGHFVHRVTLPENSKVDHVKTYMDNGVLTIHVPKHRIGNNRVRNVQISLQISHG